MEIMIFCGIYLVELVCYLVVLRMLFDVQVRTKVWMMAGVLLPVVIEGLPVKTFEKNILVTISILIIMFVSLKGSMRENGIRLILVLLLLDCVDGIFSDPCKKIILIMGSNYIDNISYLVARCCTVMSIILLNGLKKKLKKFNKIHINSIIYLIIGIFISLMMFCLGILKQVVMYLPNSRFSLFYNILSMAILISILLLVIFVIYIKNTHERMEELLKTERLLKESQVNYYKQILKKETDTRKYRHDMVNHLVYIQDLLYRGRIEDSKSYLSNILGGFKEIQRTYYTIGIEMVDTIMNYFFGMLSKSVKIDIKGKCPLEIHMEDTDICVIFSNLFQNAVEEIENNDIKNAKIMVGIQRGKQYVEIYIKNSLHNEINEKYIDKNGLPISHKVNRRDHGIGMVNVKNTIEKSNGDFKWYQEKNYFCVKVILPIK